MRQLLFILIMLFSSNANAQFFKELYNDCLHRKDKLVLANMKKVDPLLRSC